MARLYTEAIASTYHTKVFVPKQRYLPLMNLERELHSRWIPPKNYAFEVCNRLMWFVKKQKWTHLPLNVFCGQWAISYYEKRIGKQEFEEPTTWDEEQALLLRDELTVARLYIDENVVGRMRMGDVVTMVESMLSEEWVELFEQRRRKNLIAQAMEILCEEYGMSAKTYDDLVCAWTNTSLIDSSA